MTVEHRLIFGLADIQAVTCACTECKLRISVHPSEIKPDALRKCPACGAEWLSDAFTAESSVPVHPLTILLTCLPSALRNAESRKVRVLLEFAEPDC